MKKPFHQRVGDFLEGKGFYIVLFLCVAAIGISGYYLFDSLTRPGPEAPAAATASITVTPSARPAGQPEHSVPPATPARPSPTPAAPAETPAAAPAAETQAPAPTPAEAGERAPASFLWPVQGEVAAAFHVEELVYNPTMDDWRVHDGVDIAASVGAQVRAAAAGTVSAVVHDPLMGTAVTVTHGGGLTTTYANLAEVPAVEEGDAVAAGDVLGAVGETAIAESALASHLHFAMTDGGEPVDPLDYLP